MCQFSKLYNISTIEELIKIDVNTTLFSIEEVINSVKLVDVSKFGQEPLAQIGIDADVQISNVDVELLLATLKDAALEYQLFRMS